MDGEPGVPLGEFLDNRPGTGVGLWCLGCGHKQALAMERVVAQLNARGLEGRRVGIRALAGMVRKPCPRCGARTFESRPDFPSVPMGFGSRP